LLFPTLTVPGVGLTYANDLAPRVSWHVAPGGSVFTVTDWLGVVVTVAQADRLAATASKAK
jgi:hypothetical protein